MKWRRRKGPGDPDVETPAVEKTRVVVGPAFPIGKPWRITGVVHRCQMPTHDDWVKNQWGVGTTAECTVCNRRFYYEGSTWLPERG